MWGIIWGDSVTESGLEPITTAIDPLSWADWLVSAPVMGWVTWIGFILTFVGLIFAIYQATAAKRASVAAKTAADALKLRIDASNAAFASGQLIAVSSAIQNNQFSVAQALFDPIKRSLHIQSLHAEFLDSDAQDLKRRLGIVDYQLILAIEPNQKFNRVSLTKAISGVMEISARWEAVAQKKASALL